MVLALPLLHDNPNNRKFPIDPWCFFSSYPLTLTHIPKQPLQSIKMTAKRWIKVVLHIKSMETRKLAEKISGKTYSALSLKCWIRERKASSILTSITGFSSFTSIAIFLLTLLPLKHSKDIHRLEGYSYLEECLGLIKKLTTLTPFSPLFLPFFGAFPSLVYSLVCWYQKKMFSFFLKLIFCYFVSKRENIILIVFICD